MIILIVWSCLIPIIYLLEYFYMVRVINQDKMYVYHAMISLPKSIISKVIEQYKFVKNQISSMDTRKSDDELKKQDQNLLKILSTNINNQQSVSNELFSLILFNIIPVIISLIFVIFWMSFFRNAGSSLIGSIPHLITASTSYYTELAVLDHFMSLIHMNYGYYLQLTDSKDFISEAKSWLTKGRSSYLTLLYGNAEINILPFKGFLDHTEDNCETEIDSLHNMVSCFRPTVLVAWTQLTSLGIINRFVENETENEFIGNSTEDDSIFLYHILQSHLYTDFFSELLENIHPNFQKDIDVNKPFSTSSTLLLCLLVLVFEGMFFFLLSKFEKNVKFCLQLLQHCPISAVVSNSQISNLLAGNFLSKFSQRYGRDNLYFEKLIDNLPDSVITFNLEGIIKSANKATERILEISAEEIQNKHISFFVRLCSKRFSI